MGGKKKEVKEKPLEKMTATELRVIAKDIPSIIGAHGMNKAELISEIKEARGIVDEHGKKATGKIRELKKKIRVLKVKREKFIEAQDDRMAAIYRKKITTLKKKTRRVA